MEQAKRPCRKCLPEGMSEEKYLLWLATYIQRMDESVKAEDAVYAQRIAVCEACPHLAGGTCRACGCFVIFRCVARASICPYGYWT